MVEALGYYAWYDMGEIVEKVGKKCPEATWYDIHKAIESKAMMQAIPEGHILCSRGCKYRIWPAPLKFTIKEAEKKMEGILSDGEWHLEEELMCEVIGRYYEPSTWSEPYSKAIRALSRLKHRLYLEEKDLETGLFSSAYPSSVTIYRMPEGGY